MKKASTDDVRIRTCSKALFEEKEEQEGKARTQRLKGETEKSVEKVMTWKELGAIDQWLGDVLVLLGSCFMAVVSSLLQLLVVLLGSLESWA